MTAASPVLDVTVVIPTVGRPSLHELLRDLTAQPVPAPAQVLVVDDRKQGAEPLDVTEHVGRGLPVRVLSGFGHGPAAARNLGWQVADSSWVAFLDDDVRLRPDWTTSLAADLQACGPRDAASQGRLEVPLPRDRRPTDWERNTHGLQDAWWPTADMAYRRAALVSVHGFDERFPRAYREDADLALRVRSAGWELRRGDRTTLHPVRAADGAVSVRVQRGNADDALMRRLHGPTWRESARVGRGRLPWHVATVLSGGLALGGLAVRLLRTTVAGGRRAPSRLPPATVVGGLAWLGLTADFTARRVLPGPRDRAEVRRMLWTSAVIPVAAVRHRLAGEWRHRGGAPSWPPRVAAVLFDRDGTLVHDVPYNADPTLVKPVDGAREALDTLRRHGVRVGVVTNQSGIGRGLLEFAQVDAVNAAVEEQLGPFDTWQVCPHTAQDGCACRKPAPGLVRQAAVALGVPMGQCVVIGDIGSDVHAARAAGARSVLVPTAETRSEEVRDAPCVAATIEDAVELVLAGGSDG
ncbi:MAG TPA: HAD-IIIA family hydrolase [Segeticoccus sp.]|uniref:HAD-IIIA family hydrolase n=1 Tax=Segeticoccus sp. TaxID=2706531 RepID=UPI002D7EC07F|nr:HAD-IIIA family hydrolase [Segeticoccus sp.]HET8600765.1 HAD-IIIA family hydrolase [Segeticoccus sp.]